MGTSNPTDAVTVIGECVADAFTDRARPPAVGLTLQVRPGGGPANTAATLARLGTPTRFLGRLSQDVFGAMLRDRLGAAGVDLSGSVDAAEHSTLAVADVDDAGDASYTFLSEGAADWQWSDEELAAALRPQTACVHTGSLALALSPGGARIEDALAAVRGRATVCLDPNVRTRIVPSALYRERLDRWCRLTDILRLSRDDLAELLPGASPEEACDTWHAAGVPLVLVTLGGEGVLASLRGTRLTIPAPPTQVVDTVGAGDAFTAGLLHSLRERGRLGGRLDALTTDDVAAACGHGTQIAAAACSVPGADPPLGNSSPALRPGAGRPNGPALTTG
jgi:fructokinase